jgi:hypothetical protein
MKGGFLFGISLGIGFALGERLLAWAVWVAVWVWGGF